MTADGAQISLGRIQLWNWLLLLGLSGTGWWLYSPLVARSVLIGGVIAGVSFLLLKRDLTNLLNRGPLAAVKVRFFIKYYARLALVACLLFILVKYRAVHVVGLLVGLSTVLASIVLNTAAAARKTYFCKS